MDKIVYFDYCALCTLIVLFLSTIFRGLTKGRVNRMFLFITLICIITTIADICAVNFDMHYAGAVTAKYIAHVVYLVLHIFTTLLYAYYIFALTDTWHKYRDNLIRVCLLWSPFLLCAMLLLVVNLIEPVMFCINENGQYIRGPLFILLYVESVIYMVFGMVYLIGHRKVFSKRRFISLISVFPLMFTAVIIQYFYPVYVLEMFANALGLLFVSMMVQRPEEIIDIDTGLNKLAAYVDDMNRAFISEKAVDIVMINVTNYASIRDMLGYDGMNHLMRSVARKMTALNESYHLNAMLYYLSQGKFRFVIEKPHMHQTEEIAKEMNKILKQDMHINQMEVNLLCCVCITHCPEDINDVDSLLAFGNDLNAKFYNGSVLYASDIYRKDYYDIMRDIDRIIEDALQNHRFEVYYQPIYSVNEKRFNSAEALLRLKNETYGFISPDIFISAAEKSGAIHKIGDYVLEEVCSFIASEEFDNLQLDYIEVNLSVVQCMQNNLAKHVIEILDQYHVEPGRINLEITETAATYSQNTMMENLDVLVNAGICFSLDDFGTGYSNMRRIATMPFHIVKLDKTFTQINQNPNLLIVLENTIKMIKAMNMKIVVEGIETEQLVNQFSNLQCEYIQGYYYSKPIPREEFVAFIQNSQ